MNAGKTVQVSELRRLLVQLTEHRPDICFRYRLIGQLWVKNFMRVVAVTEKGVLLNDETSDKFLKLQDLSYIIQFELDKSFQVFQPYSHYDVVNESEGSPDPQPKA